MHPMKKIKKNIRINAKFYLELHNPYFNYNKFVELLNSRIKLLRLVEDNVTNLNKFDYNNEEEDTESHFITRLVCSTIDWTSRWFIKQETKLFNLRLNQEDTRNNKYNIQNVRLNNNLIFIDPLSNNLNYNNNLIYIDSLSNNQIVNNNNNHIVNNNQCNYNNNSELLLLNNCYVHFSRVSELLANREIKFKKGYGILNNNQSKILLRNEYRNILENKMNNLKNKYKKYPDERLEKMCQSIFIEKSSNNLTGVLNINEHSKYFPPCITKMIDLLKSTKHLKYNDRQSLCLFFKDLNYPLENTVEFFREYFQISKSDFDKTYLYNIRHNYGLEGKKANYMCFSCSKLSNLKNSENKSSCPFVDDKKYILKKYNNIDIEDIYKDSRYSGRCKRLVEIFTNTRYESIITTPIKYFMTYKENDKK